MKPPRKKCFAKIGSGGCAPRLLAEPCLTHGKMLRKGLSVDIFSIEKDQLRVYVR
jgi:hypothetical protein